MLSTLRGVVEGRRPCGASGADLACLARGRAAGEEQVPGGEGLLSVLEAGGRWRCIAWGAWGACGNAPAAILSSVSRLRHCARVLSD